MKAEELAKTFHKHYELLAPGKGYETRKATAVPWWELPQANRELMIGTAQKVIGELIEPIEKERREFSANNAALEAMIESQSTELAELRRELEPLRRKIVKLDARNKADRNQFSKDREKLLRRLAVAKEETASVVREKMGIEREMRNDAPLMKIVKRHADLEKPRVPNCTCSSCHLREAIENREEGNAALKKKNKELREDLNSFRGPKSKKKKAKV